MWNVGWTGKGKWVCLEKGQGVYRIARKRKGFVRLHGKMKKSLWVYRNRGNAFVGVNKLF